MATLKERLIKWNRTRSLRQKATDVFFWVLLVLLILPGPRKAVSTAVNRVILLMKSPALIEEGKQARLTDNDYNWYLSDAEGNSLQLRALKGKVIFLNFWATWCPPCMAELPEIQKVYKKYGDSVTFLLVTGQDPADVEIFLEKQGFDLPVTYSTSPLPLLFDHRAIPATYIISRDGKIAVRKTGAVNWDSRGTDRVIRQLLR